MPVTGINKLTDRIIETKIAKAKVGGKLPKTLRLTDGGGLYLEAKTNGALHFYCQYYDADGNRPREALGAYPVPTSLAAARTRRDEIKTQLGGDICPKTARRAAKAKAKTENINNALFQIVADTWRAQAYPEATMAPGTVADQKRYVRYLCEGPDGRPDLAIGKFPIQSITSAHVLAILDVFNTAGLHPTRERVQITALGILGWAVGRHLQAHPLAHVDFAKQYGKSAGHDPRPAQHTPDGFGAVLRKIAAYAPVKKPVSGTVLDPRVARAYLDLLALTFVRPVELRKAKWAEFNLDGDKPLWIVPAARLKQRTERKRSASKSKHGEIDHNVPLAPQAVAILRKLREIVNGPVLFPSPRGADFASADTFLDAMTAAGIDTATEQCPHGFRASATTILTKAKDGKHYLFLPQAIEFQKNHINGDAYFRDDLLDERREMLVWWANKIDQLRGKGAVVPFPQKAAA